MITFIKTLSYSTKLEEGDSFEYVTKLLRQEIEPRSTAYACFCLPHRVKVFHSPHRRVVDTLDEGLDNKYIALNELREIPFDLGKFCSKKEWERGGSDIVREFFKKAFISDTLMKKRDVIFEEIKSILKKCSDEKEVLVISHSFKLKLIELYIKTKGEIVKNPTLINKYMPSGNKTYQFGGYFKV